MEATLPSAAMHGFIQHLRLNGGHAVIPDASLALDALRAWRKPPSYDQAKHVLRAVFATDRQSWDRFDSLCDAYWLHRGVKHALPDAAAGMSPAATQLWQPQLDGLRDGGDDGGLVEDSGRDAPGKGPERTTAERNIKTIGSLRGLSSRLNIDDVNNELNRDQVVELARRVALALRFSPSRRYRPHRRGRRVDFRRTIRRSLATGGESFALARRDRGRSRVRITTLLDVSNSMKNYINFFLLFAKGLSAAGWRPETFLFHTQLLRVTESLLERGQRRATERLALQAGMLGGGTKIASSLLDFRRRYGRVCMGRRSAVFIISDGYDAEEPQELVRALAELRTYTQRIIWLSPTIARADVLRPRTRSLRAAIGKLDLLSPIASIQDLEKLLPQLERL